MTADTTPLPPSAPSEWEELARDIDLLRAVAQECDDSADACDTANLARVRARRRMQAASLRAAAERIARLLAVAQRAEDADAAEREAVTRWLVTSPDRVRQAHDGTYTAHALGLSISGYSDAWNAARAAFYSFHPDADFTLTKARHAAD